MTTPLPKDLHELQQLDQVIKAISKLVLSRSGNARKKNVNNFAEYAADISSVLGPGIGKDILSLQKSILANDIKLSAKTIKVAEAFEKQLTRVQNAKK